MILSRPLGVAGHPLNESGIIITRSKDGDCLYSKWDPTFKITKLDMFNWELEFESRFQFIGGTGKYSDLKESGTCRGERTPIEDPAKCEGEWEY